VFRHCPPFGNFFSDVHLPYFLESSQSALHLPLHRHTTDGDSKTTCAFLCSSIVKTKDLELKQCAVLGGDGGEYAAALGLYSQLIGAVMAAVPRDNSVWAIVSPK
jgi:hypothetical protein